MEPADSSAFDNPLDLQIARLHEMAVQLQNAIINSRSASLPTSVYHSVNHLAEDLGRLHTRLTTFDAEPADGQALAQIGSLVNSSLEIDEVLQVVMDTIIRLTGAERGFLMLKDEAGALVMRIARDWEQESLDPSEFEISHTIINRVLELGSPILTTNAQEDPRFTGHNSIVNYNLRSILCVPLNVKSQLIGVMYADNRIRSSLFTQKDLNLLAAFANQAAVALENARLFASVRSALVETTELKSLMDHVFESITSGVLTVDAQERILMGNRAAQKILGRAAMDLVGQPLTPSLAPLGASLSAQLHQVLQTKLPLQDLEASTFFSDRGRVDLRFSISPLQDGQQPTQGVAIVFDDLTEKRKLEAQQRLFERMVSPQVIDQLDPNQLKVGGQRATITVLFADIRGFTSFSEAVPPEELVTVLNEYLAAAADEILKEEGTIDKFLGDAVMAWFNAPMAQPDHALRAVRAAWGIHNALNKLHARLPASSYLSFGVGIHSGEAVLGLVGTERRLDFTAIGDCVNTAKRIQENTNPGQILISQAVLNGVRRQVTVKKINPILAKGKREPVEVFELTGVT